MKTEHTPGPWMTEDEYRGGSPFLIYAKGSIHIANLCNATPAESASVLETVANARLIAAAPELLTALSALVDWATNPAITDWLNRSGVISNYGETVLGARAAIAKATTSSRSEA